MLSNSPIEVSAAVVINDNKILMAKRSGGYLNDLWEFPGGKIEKGETAEEAAKRELCEELNISIEPQNTILILKHQYPDKTVKLHFVLCYLGNNKNQTIETINSNTNAKWFNPKDVIIKQLCPADATAFETIDWEKLFLDSKITKKYILVINPGSRTTKIAIFNKTKSIAESEITHTSEELSDFRYSYEQLEYRYSAILKEIDKLGYKETDFCAVIGRGGPLKPVESGVYKVNEAMIKDIKKGGEMDHASLLGGLLSEKIAHKNDIPAFIADPVSVDEFDEVARISGLPILPRVSRIHALNMKAVAEEIAEKDGKKLNEVNYIIAHLGGGFSISPMRKGRLIDVNDSNEAGPMTPERSGTIPLIGFLKICYSGKYKYEELFKMLVGKGGLYGYLGTADCREIDKMIDSGNDYAKLCLEAMAYQISKEIGGAAAALKGKVDKIILTGGVAYNKRVVDYVKDHVEFIAPVETRPGQNEMKALARHALRALNHSEIIKTY